ncbi:MAG: DUF6069 family protein [Kineosporiaceae bacterium]
MSAVTTTGGGGVLRTARAVVPTAVLASAVAAAGTTGAAALARAAGVTFEVADTAIPLLAFGFWTVVGGVLGLLAALALRDRRRFVVLAVAGTAVSLVPAVVAPDDAATKAVLVVLHVLAAAVLVPAIAARLPAR